MFQLDRSRADVEIVAACMVLQNCHGQMSYVKVLRKSRDEGEVEVNGKW